MNNKNTITVGILALVVGIACGFYGGMKANVNRNFSLPFIQGQGQLQNQGGYARGGMMNGQNGGQQAVGGNGARGGRLQSGGGQGRGMNIGEVIAKDDKSITIKIADGGSKIIFYSDTTTVGKSTLGSATDLAIGQQVRINGADNADGSTVAQNIQINQ
jgi:hypothetical protein